MIAYACVAVAPIILKLCFPKVNTNREHRKYYLCVMGIILFLFMGLRTKYLGSEDTFNYCNIMNRAIQSDSFVAFYRPASIEPGFQFFVFLLSRFFSNAQWIIVATSAIYTISILMCLSKNSKNLPVALTMYICLGMMTFEMQGMRQAIAMSICLFAYEFAKQRKVICFGLTVLLAMQFHQTAIVFVCVYFLFGIKYTYKSIALAILGCIAAILLSSRIAVIANTIFDRAYNTTVDQGGFFAAIIYLIIIFMTLWLTKKPIKEHGNAGVFFVVLLGATCYLMRYVGTQAAERISYYFIFAQCILLPNTIVEGRLTERSKPLLDAMVVVLAIALFLYRLRGSDLVPYYFFWNV